MEIGRTPNECSHKAQAASSGGPGVCPGSIKSYAEYLSRLVFPQAVVTREFDVAHVRFPETSGREFLSGFDSFAKGTSKDREIVWDHFDLLALEEFITGCFLEPTKSKKEMTVILKDWLGRFLSESGSLQSEVEKVDEMHDQALGQIYEIVKKMIGFARSGINTEFQNFLEEEWELESEVLETLRGLFPSLSWDTNLKFLTNAFVGHLRERVRGLFQIDCGPGVMIFSLTAPTLGPRRGGPRIEIYFEFVLGDSCNFCRCGEDRVIYKASLIVNICDAEEPVRLSMKSESVSDKCCSRRKDYAATIL